MRKGPPGLVVQATFGPTCRASHPAPGEHFQIPAPPLVAPSLPSRLAPFDLQSPSAGAHQSLPAIRACAAENRSSETPPSLTLLRLDLHHPPIPFATPFPPPHRRGQLLFP